MAFKQSKSNIQRIKLESVLLSNAKWDTFIPSKYLFLLLSFQFCIIYGTCSQNVQVTSKLPPQKTFYYKTYFVFKTISSIIMIR